MQKVNELQSGLPMDGIDAYPGTFHPVDFVIPVGPIFAYVLGECDSYPCLVPSGISGDTTAHVATVTESNYFYE